MAFVIAVDFDGTCVDHRYPDVGADIPGAAQWLKRFAAAGAQLILWTMRSDGDLREGDEAMVLTHAVNWFRDRDIPLHGVNANPDQASWTESPKVYANVYVDDAAYGCPLRDNPRAGGRPFADWDVIGPGVAKLIPVAAWTTA